MILIKCMVSIVGAAGIWLASCLLLRKDKVEIKKRANAT